MLPINPEKQPKKQNQSDRSCSLSVLMIGVLQVFSCAPRRELRQSHFKLLMNDRGIRFHDVNGWRSLAASFQRGLHLAHLASELFNLSA